MKNIGLRMVSLCLATLLWYFVTTNVTSVTLTLPVEITNSPPDLLMLSPSDSQVKVKVSGPTFILSSLSNQLPQLRKKIPNTPGNRIVLPIRADDLDLPSAVQVVSIEPQELELTFEKRMSREVAIEVPRLGTLRESLELEKVSLFPEKIVVSGPESEIRDLRRIETYPLDLREITESSTRTLSVRKPGRLTSISLDDVEVNVTVASLHTSKVIGGVKVSVVSEQSEKVRFGVEPESVKVVAEGDRVKVEQLTAGGIFASVDVRGITSLSDPLPVRFKKIEGVKLTSEPPSVKISRYFLIRPQKR